MRRSTGCGPTGARQTRLTDDPAVDIRPAWSPDGRRIAFNSDRADGEFDVFAMKADGSSARDLTDDPNFDFAPDWQPRR